MANEPKPKDKQDQAHTPEGYIDLNHASKDDLLEIPGIDERAAEWLLRFRDQHGGIQSWGDLNEAPLPPADLERIRPYIRF